MNIQAETFRNQRQRGIDTPRYRTEYPVLTTFVSAFRNRQHVALVLWCLYSRILDPRSDRKFAVRCEPALARSTYALWKALQLNGWKVTHRAEADVVVRWDDQTYSSRKLGSARMQMNNGATDISKRYVEDVYKKVFGRDLRIDPTKYEGMAIRKSNLNCTHDGAIVNCPISEDFVDGDHVFERLIDNRFNHRLHLDIRVPVIFGEIPFVYRKFLSRESPFRHQLWSEIASTESVLMVEEQEKIIEFCKAFPIDVCELDILRDRGSGEIYIVDVNRTPAGPTLGLTFQEAKLAMQMWADALARGVERQLALDSNQLFER